MLGPGRKGAVAASNLTVERDGRTAVMTLDRPAALNALSRSLASELREHACALAADRSVRAVVVTGAGERAFCAGADIAEMSELAGADEFHAFIVALEAAVAAVAAMPQPVVAAVDGVALGGGFELALACDLRVVSEASRFGLPEVKLGLLPGLGGTQRAIRMLPPAVAARLLLLGDPLDAAEAHRHGLCEPPVPRGTALAVAVELAGRLAAGPPLAHAAAKDLMRDGPLLPLADAIQCEQEVGRRLFATADAAEGVSAFMEKRVASFEGR
jgi:enoyl-CoA hydratase